MCEMRNQHTSYLHVRHHSNNLQMCPRTYVHTYRVRTYRVPTHHSLISSARDILEYLELGTLFFDAVKSLWELSSASIRIQEKRELSKVKIPEFCRFLPIRQT